MNEDLLEISTKQLLKKFGAGNHKPGSGSAAAFQGLLSAQLIRTVIDLTNDPKRRSEYAEALPELLRIAERIDRSIYPALEKIFNEDSVQFDRVIRARQAREAETDPLQKKILAARALNELKPATEMPIEIAEHCLDLADAAVKVFERGFKSARGDSGVAISAALSAVYGSLTIVDLNLLSFDGSDWAEATRVKANSLREKLKRSQAAAATQLKALEDESERKHHFYVRAKNFVNRKTSGASLTDTEIEQIAIEMQRFIWINRDLIWKRNVPANPFDVLDPKIAFQVLNYSVEQVITLGQHRIYGTLVEVAGEIDQEKKHVSISEQFQPSIQNFTAAHELGHALLHNQAVMHRDRPLDGSVNFIAVDSAETQADRFAAYFLMPKKLVKKTFLRLFLTERFEINEDTAFALTGRSSDELYRRCSNKRALARLLASAENYNGIHFDSIAKQFRVSVEAMAIRLEELNLLQYPGA